ncbi:hypothetical protein J5226_12750 [Lysobacter sp. K5869]|uniref:hypothetical protein n=1 Tax=Lysobacter sp. K5869 TaxID=2820808 RepID=UPI001C06223F|nr:hypothetical protein [Lysobacter sp. K5869]QWP79194.1 hypothetical protein J5226_12750 [Lysobacter sp. K5869]
MSRNFELDTGAAKEASNAGKRITQPGPYVGTFRAAFYEKNERGTESVNLILAAENGQETGLLSLYTHNGDGEALPSYKTLNAIMACLRLRRIETKPGKVTLYDFTAGEDVVRDRDVYPALMGPRIGLVLQGEEHIAGNGETKVRMIVVGVFDPASRRMADEILSQASEAKSLDRLLAWLDKNPIKPLRGTPRTSSGSSSTSRGGGSSRAPSDDFADDDIPF